MNLTGNKMKKTIELGSEFWNDSCDPGELEKAVAAGATGATSNPVIVASAIKNNKNHYRQVLKDIMTRQPLLTEDELSWKLIESLGLEASRLLLPVFERSNGTQGKLCLQVSPAFFPGDELMTKHGRHLASLAPNIAIKIPATEAGLKTIETLTAEGISTNATVSFSVSQAIACAEAVERGLLRAKKRGINLDLHSSWCTIMVGRVDDYIATIVNEKKLCIEPGHLPWAGISVMKKSHELYKSSGYKTKLLAAAYRHHLHWSQLIGDQMVLSIPYPWWNRFNQSDIPVESNLSAPVPSEILNNLLEKIPEFRDLYQEDGLSSEEFSDIKAAKNTLHQFLDGLDQVRLFVRNEMLS